jgi:hypothetical protein
MTVLKNNSESSPLPDFQQLERQPKKGMAKR